MSSEGRRRKRSAAELREAYREQWQLLHKSCQEYDRGDESEAKRIALSLRLLLHDTARMRSLVGQVGLKDALFFDTAQDAPPGNLLPSFCLVQAHVGPGGARYVAPLGDTMWPVWLIPFNHWWAKPVIVVPGTLSLTRAQLVLAMADQDGGAHVDPSIDDTYYRVTRENAVGYVASSGGREYPVPHIATASVRQIAHEMRVSLAAPRRMIPNDLPEPVNVKPMKHVVVDASGRSTSSDVIPRNYCMCHSGLLYRDCHARGGKNRELCGVCE